jgi:hypothetical protein
MAGKGMLSIGSELPDPLAQHVLMEVQIARRLATATPRSFTNLTASTLNSRLNFLLCIPILQFR